MSTITAIICKKDNCINCHDLKIDYYFYCYGVNYEKVLLNYICGVYAGLRTIE